MYTLSKTIAVYPLSAKNLKDYGIYHIVTVTFN